MNEYELYHYGVKGMKWGVRKKVNDYRIQRLTKKVDKFETKRDQKQAKADKLFYKATKRGESSDLYKKSAKYKAKSSVLEKRANKLDDTDVSKQLRLKKKAAKYRYKSSEAKMKAVKKGLTDVQNVKLNAKGHNQLVKAAKMDYIAQKSKMKLNALETRNIELGRSMIED